MMSNDLLYVYCISNLPPPDAEKYTQQGLTILKSGDFYTYLRMVSADEFSEDHFRKNLADLQWVEKNARDHLKVITMIMEECTLIPFKFGTIFETAGSLYKFIGDYTGSLYENLRGLEGKEEWSVKVYCARNAIIDKIDELSEEAAAMELQIMASSPGKAFLLKRKKDDLIAAEVDRLCRRYGQTYYNELKSLSDSSCLNNLLPKEFSGRDESMILNATFLVEKQNLELFLEAISLLQTRDSDSGFLLEATGPWPPFSFIAIKENPHA